MLSSKWAEWVILGPKIDTSEVFSKSYLVFSEILPDVRHQGKFLILPKVGCFDFPESSFVRTGDLLLLLTFGQGIPSVSKV